MSIAVGSVKYLTVSDGINKPGLSAGDRTKMADLTAIDKLINLLIMIRDAVLSLELCVETDMTNPTPDLVGNQNINGVAGNPPTDRFAKKGDTSNKTPVVVFPTDKEVRAFVINRMGETPDFADQVIAAGKSKDNISGVALGSLNSNSVKEEDIQALKASLGECAKTLDPQRILELTQIMSKWRM